MPIEKSVLESAVDELEEKQQTIRVLRAALRIELPDIMKELEAAETSIAALQERVKTAARPLGTGHHVVCGHVLQVRNAASKVEIDVDGLVDRAKTEGDLNLLLENGVLTYNVIQHQIARLPGVQRIRYEQYVKVTAGTASVLLPPELR